MSQSEPRYLAFVMDFHATEYEMPLEEAVLFCARLDMPPAVAVENAGWHPNDIFDLYADLAPEHAKIIIATPPSCYTAANHILVRRIADPPCGVESKHLRQADKELRQLLGKSGYTAKMHLSPKMFQLYPRLRQLQTPSRREDPLGVLPPLELTLPARPANPPDLRILMPSRKQY